MKLSVISIIIYAILLFVGGIIGFIRADSLASFFAGSVSAAFLLACVPLLLKGNRTGGIIALCEVLVLDAFFTYRFAQSLAFMPSGLMALLSLAMVAILVSQLRSCRK